MRKQQPLSSSFNGRSREIFNAPVRAAARLKKAGAKPLTLTKPSVD
jgi:hypothetical protein